MTIIYHNQNTLKIAYRFKGLEHLVADKNGNFYILEHCTNKRTSKFKMLIKSKYRIYYKRTPYSLFTLRKLHIRVSEIIKI